MPMFIITPMGTGMPDIHIMGIIIIMVITGLFTTANIIGLFRQKMVLTRSLG